MDFKVRGEDLLGDEYVIASDVEVPPGHILLSPHNDRLYDPKITPLDNSKVWPSWRRKAGSGFKACQGTSDYISLGGTWRLPAPVRMRPSIEGQKWEARWDTHDTQGLAIDVFEYEASGEACPFNQNRMLPEGNQIKIVNPWTIKTAPGWSTLLLPCWMEEPREWSLMPGVVNTDYYHTMNWVINIYTDDEFVIPTGWPIGEMITFPRNQQNIKFGQTKIAEGIINKGMNSPFTIPADRSGEYRKEQREASPPEICPVEGIKKPFRKRFSDWLFGEVNPINDNTL